MMRDLSSSLAYPFDACYQYLRLANRLSKKDLSQSLVTSKVNSACGQDTEAELMFSTPFIAVTP